MNIRYKYIVSRSDNKKFSADQSGIGRICKIRTFSEQSEVSEFIEGFDEDLIIDMPEIKSVIKNPSVITVRGRRWFQKGPGNTYHSAEIYLDDVQVDGIEFAYGYGSQYLYNAFVKLQKDGLITPAISDHEGFLSWAKRNGVELIYSCDDVQKKKDL